jgi:hypothetical protein
MAASVISSGLIGLGVVSIVLFSNAVLSRFVGLHVCVLCFIVAATAFAELSGCVVFSGVGEVFSLAAVALPELAVLMGLGVVFFVIAVSPLELLQPGFSLCPGLSSG